MNQALNIHAGWPLADKVILLNSPPNTGKDYAAVRLNHALNAKVCSFKEVMFDLAMGFTGLDQKTFFSIYNDRTKKETPQPEFHGMSPRELMIWISEEVCKPKFGDNFFGRIAAAKIPKNGAIFSDSGFPEEVGPLIEQFGAENIYIVRFTRNGATFEGDSRSYLQEGDLPGCNFIDLTNDGDINQFVNTISSWVTSK